MNISVNGRHMTVRQDLNDMIEKKMSKFDKFFPEDANAVVTCKCDHDKKIVEITIYIGSTIFRAEKSSDSFQSSLEAAIDVIERQIRKNKTRIQKQIKRDVILPDDSTVDEVDEEDVYEIRTKTFPIKPMTVEEAILQMNLLNHQFYMFYDVESSKNCVVYKRHENKYGLIIPSDE